MRRRRKKRFVYRRGAPLIGLCLIVIICSGAVLVIMEKTGGISFGTDEMNYISGAIAAGAYINKEDEIAQKSAENEDNIQTYDENGNNAEQLNSPNAETQEIQTQEVGDDKSKEKGILKLLLCTALSYYEENEKKDNEDNAVVVSGDNGEAIKVVSSAVEETVNSEAVESEVAAAPVVSDIQGAVFIYHTHSTESYEPYSAGNYHVTGSQGTVRNVANNLTEVLESKGIKVYHDTTLHDNPSYTNSYGRSLNTAQNYLSQYSDITVMIDLHRDAIASAGKKYNTIEVNGGRATSFNIVVGRQNNNYSELMNFANLVISKANELYPGLGGRVIEREYKFNEFLSNHYILAEVGNNGNTIEEAEMTGRLLGDVIEAVMREI